MTLEEAIYRLRHAEIVFGRTTGKMQFLKALNLVLDAAEAQEVKHGKWEDEYYDEITELYYHTCSNCNTEITATCFDSYCPNCGAKMDGKENKK